MGLPRISAGGGDFGSARTARRLSARYVSALPHRRGAEKLGVPPLRKRFSRRPCAFDFPVDHLQGMRPSCFAPTLDAELATVDTAHEPVLTSAAVTAKELDKHTTRADQL